MENRNIQDFQITASSEWDSNHGPTNGRLNFKAGGGRTGAWSAKSNDANQWFQVDFRKETIVSEIYIQGRQDRDQWVTSYTVSYSNDGKNYRLYTQNGQLKVKATNRRLKYNMSSSRFCKIISFISYLVSHRIFLFNKRSFTGTLTGILLSVNVYRQL